MGVGRNSQGEFQTPVLHVAYKCTHSGTTRRAEGMSPRKSFDFRPSEIISEENTARIPRNMQTARPCRRSAVIKHDVDCCDRECRVQVFPQRSLGERKVKDGYCSS